jgi:hypothetical protein
MECAVREQFEEIHTILKGLAKSQAAADARMDRRDERFDKRMRGFEKLVRIGMAELRRFEKETDRKIEHSWMPSSGPKPVSRPCSTPFARAGTDTSAAKVASSAP